MHWGIWRWDTNQRTGEDMSTCSLLEQRPGGSAGILISSGDMFLTFSENKAARETENSMVKYLSSTGAAFNCALACKPSQVGTRISSMVPGSALHLCLIRTKMCLQPLNELPRNNKKRSFVCWTCPALLMHIILECSPLGCHTWYCILDGGSLWGRATTG